MYDASPVPSSGDVCAAGVGADEEKRADALLPAAVLPGMPGKGPLGRMKCREGRRPAMKDQQQQSIKTDERKCRIVSQQRLLPQFLKKAEQRPVSTPQESEP